MALSFIGVHPQKPVWKLELQPWNYQHMKYCGIELVQLYRHAILNPLTGRSDGASSLITRATQLFLWSMESLRGCLSVDGEY